MSKNFKTAFDNSFHELKKIKANYQNIWKTLRKILKYLLSTHNFDIILINYECISENLTGEIPTNFGKVFKSSREDVTRNNLHFRKVYLFLHKI